MVSNAASTSRAFCGPRLRAVDLWIDDVVVILAPQYHVEIPGILHALCHLLTGPVSTETNSATGQPLVIAPDCLKVELLKCPSAHHQSKQHVGKPWLKIQ
jgi:hypothetical protein